MEIAALIGFRPRLWATVWTAAALAGLIGLGTWQVQRLFWKEALIVERQAGFNAAAVPLPRSEADLAGILWQRVFIEGEYLHDRELYLAARSMRGNVGFHIVTPFLRDSGETVLINRGWVPRQRRDPAARHLGQIEGPVRVEGIVTPGAARGRFSPDNDAAGNVWLWVDLGEMAGAVGRPLQPVVVEAIETDVLGGFPIGGQTRINLPNDHMQYAFTWYALAIALGVIYVVWHRRQEREEAG
jgi:surfeit locus 1 family protein